MKTISELECCLDQLKSTVNGVTVAGDKTFTGDVTVSGDIIIESGTKGLYVSASQVVGARGAAVASAASPNATDLATAITLANELKAQLNSLLSRVRAHGLIAP